MTAFFVTGAGTDIGKTHIACALLRAWSARELEVDAFKPVLSGYDEATMAESDAGRLLAALDAPINQANIERMSLWRYAAPLAPPAAARAEGKAVPYDDVLAACRACLAAQPDALLIEGAGGVMSPIAEDKTNLDLIEALQISALLVAGTYLGAISHALTAVEALQARGVRIAALVISESANGAESPSDTAASLARLTFSPIFAVPRFATGTMPAEMAALADAFF